MKQDTLTELQEAVRFLNYTKENLSPDNLEDTREDIEIALKHIQAAIFMETPSTGRKFNLYKMTSNDEQRPVMGGIFHDGGYKVASDSHVLVAVREDYDEALEGHIIGKKGEDIIGKYPKWELVFPSKEQLEQNQDGEHAIDTAKVYDIIKLMKSEKKAAGKWGPWRRAYVKVGNTFFKAEQFALICNFMDAYNCNLIQTMGPWRAAQVIAPDWSKALIMPARTADYFDENGYKQPDREIAEVWEKHHDACIWYEVA